MCFLIIKFHSTVLTFGNSFVTISLWFLFFIEEEHILRLPRYPYSKLHHAHCLRISAVPNNILKYYVLNTLKFVEFRTYFEPFRICRLVNYHIRILLICSWRNTFYGRAWNLNVLFADQSSQVGSVIFVKAKSVRRVLSQKMSLVIILLQNVLHAIEEK